MAELPAEIRAYYEAGEERRRLEIGPFKLERARTEEILLRHLPPPPAEVLDVGGGAGAYAMWLAGAGYVVRLVDPVPLHVDQARRESETLPGGRLAETLPGDARQLPHTDGSQDVVLLLGPSLSPDRPRRPPDGASRGAPKRKPARGAMARPSAVTAYKPRARATLARPRATPSTTWDAKPMRPHSSEPTRM